VNGNIKADAINMPMNPIATKIFKPDTALGRTLGMGAAWQKKKQAKEQLESVTKQIKENVTKAKQVPPNPATTAAGIASTVFPPLGAVNFRPEGAGTVLKKVPQAALETVFPLTPLITGQQAIETIMKAEHSRQVNINPMVDDNDKQKENEKYAGLWNEGKPAVLGGGTNIFEVAGDAGDYFNIGAPEINLPELEIPDLKNIPKYILYAGAAIAGTYLLGKLLGGKK